MSIKRVLCPERLRQVPAQFSWVDQRLVQDHFVERCEVHALALYLFLITVADAQGLSYYGEAALSLRLRFNAEVLSAARRQLVELELIAYRVPVYQVLALPPVRGLPDLGRPSPAAATVATADRATTPVQLSQLFEHLGLRRDQL